MKLKNRMVISFFVIILVPLILTGVAVTGFTMYQVWSLEKKYGIEGVTYENLSNNTMLLSKMTQKTFSTLEKTASSEVYKRQPLYCIFTLCKNILQIFFQDIYFIQFFPRQIQIISSEMSVSCSLFVDRSSQIQHLDDSGRSQIEVFTDDLYQFLIAYFTRCV